MGVSTTHRQYDEFASVWKSCADVVAGQRAIHKAGVAYLPRLQGEDDDAYAARVARSDFFGATWRTIAALAGMAMRKDPAYDLPGAIEPFLKNIDLAGTSMLTMAKRLLQEVMENGRIGVLVDHPAMPENVTAMTVAIAEQLGMRPTMKLYQAKTIINWRYKTIGNATVLCLAVLKEETEEIDQKDEFKAICEDRYRVLDLDEAGFYRQRLFKVEHGEDIELEQVYPVMNGQKIGYIPFYIVGPEGIQIQCDEPPLIDLVDKNIAHYQVNSDYRHGGHKTALPTLFLAGMQDDGDPIYIGGDAAITSPDPNARGEYIEYKGQGLGALEKQLDRLERQMAVLGARMIADESEQVETLGATQIKRAGENSLLASIVMAVSDVIESALGVMAQWVGATGEIVYQINREFSPVGLSAQDLIAYMQQVQSGLMSEREYYDLLQRGDVIDGQKKFEAHQAEIGDTQTLPRPAPDNDEELAA